ncbi:PP2C family protein-serine/threonine phosphatase [Steroidobacter sp.]|uniref:PP2C family protein-serine/threonine phosphatase n=1 Tax=Steroidobacter sp. TaxID=1978227 RepID=UPI001A548D5F|nr:protein phosphatase 2C domain-containing protein [Steroidobacter sp.]MBL8264803.1 serine/threonine-protein phosphatase [Steroidobacter sp.]
MDETLVEEDIQPVYVSAGSTDVGRLRASNQDAFVEFNDVGVWSVADGMGGYRDGDVASRMVCEGLQKLSAEGSLEEAIGVLRQRMSDVNRRLYEASVRPINPIVSGSTVAILVVRRTACAVLWAGDSRVYRFRQGHLTQLTTDHTWAAELNLQHPDEEADHAITRAVGGEGTLTLDLRRDRVRLGDRYLLCSDGLTRELHDTQIAAALGAEDVKSAAKKLIDATLQAGARDNVTVVIVEAT